MPCPTFWVEDMDRQSKGAEAVLADCPFAGIDAIMKERKRKAYRPKALDEKIRATRTKVEARLLAKAKWAAVKCPYVLEVLPFSIIMTKERGKMLNTLNAVDAAIWKKAGAYLARLHFAKIVHGDYTPANLMLRDDGELIVIDFGLGSISHDTEDYAVDLLTMKKALKSDGERKSFLEGYAKEEKKLGQKKTILPLAGKIENRGRYREREE